MTTLKSCCKWEQRKGAVAGRSHEVKVLVFVLMWEKLSNCNYVYADKNDPVERNI